MRENLLLGVILTLVSGLFYTAQTMLIKIYSTTLPPLPVVIFIQSLVALLFMFPFLIKKGAFKKTLVVHNVPLHILRAFFSLGISYFLFYAVTFVPLVNAMLLINTSPLFIPLFAYIALSQKINHRLWLPLLIGFTGVALVLHPTGRALHPALLLALAGGMCWAASTLSVRHLSATNSTQTTAFYFFALSTVFSGIISIKFWVPISMPMLMIMIGIGGLYFLTQYAATWALRHAGAQLVGILFYSNILYVSLAAIWFWHVIPSQATLIGMACIVMGGILSILVESRKSSPETRNAHLPNEGSAT